MAEPRPQMEQYLYAGLTTPQEVASRQEQMNAEEDRRVARSSLEGLTLRTALEDVREVITGIPADLFGNSAEPLPLRDVLTKNDRLRGLGLLLLAVALLAVALV